MFGRLVDNTVNTGPSAMLRVTCFERDHQTGRIAEGRNVGRNVEINIELLAAALHSESSAAAHDRITYI